VCHAFASQALKFQAFEPRRWLVQALAAGGAPALE
jgi:hypothetical protein